MTTRKDWDNEEHSWRNKHSAVYSIYAWLWGWENTISMWPISYTQEARPCEKGKRQVLLREPLPHKALPVGSHSFCGILQLNASFQHQGLSLSTDDVCIWQTCVVRGCSVHYTSIVWSSIIGLHVLEANSTSFPP